MGQNSVGVDSLPEASASDGWGRRITYQVMRTQTALTPATISGLRGNINVHSDAPVTVCAVPPAGACNQLNAGNQASYVLVSHGENGFGAYIPGGGINPAPSSALELENTSANFSFVTTDRNDSGTRQFDDILVWQSAQEILAELKKSANIPSAAEVMQQRFEQIKFALLQKSVSNVTGTTPNRSYPLAAPSVGTATADTTACGPGAVANNVMPANLPGNPATTDVWGNSIRYILRVPNVTNPQPAGPACGLAVTFISYGPDGLHGTPAQQQDDVVYNIPLAELSSTFSRYGF